MVRRWSLLVKAIDLAMPDILTDTSAAESKQGLNFIRRNQLQLDRTAAALRSG